MAVQVTVVSPASKSTPDANVSRAIASTPTRTPRSVSGQSTPQTNLRPPPIHAPSLAEALSSLPSSNIKPPLSPLARHRRAPLPAQAPRMEVKESTSQYTVNVHLPNIIHPDMVTISAIKGDKMKIVADAWHMESNCHYEWLIAFPPRDVDMTQVSAKFGDDGLLTVDIRRVLYRAYHAGL